MTAGGRADMANQDFLFCGLELAIIDSTSVETPRREDFVFERTEEGKRNGFEYSRNGYTDREMKGDVVLIKYLKDVGSVHLATLHDEFDRVSSVFYVVYFSI